MMKRILTCALLFGLAVGLFAQMLTLEQAQEIALHRNPTYQAKISELHATQWEEKKALTALLPTGSLSGGYTKLDETPLYPSIVDTQTVMVEGEDNTQSYGLSFNWPLFQGGKIWLGYRMSRDQRIIAEWDVHKEKINTLSTVQTYYFDVLEANDQMEVDRQDLAASRKHLETAQTRFELGTLSRADLLKMKSQTANKEVALLQTQNLVKVYRKRLENFLQKRDFVELEPIPFDRYADLIDRFNTIDQAAIETTLNRLLTCGHQNNPGLQISRQSEKISSKNVWLQRGNFLPSLNLNYAKDWIDGTEPGNNYENSERITLSASIPIFPLFDNYSGLKKAQYQLRKSRQENVVAKDGIDLAIESSWLNLISSAKQVLAAQIALEYSEESYQQMEERFRNGLISTTELLDTEVLLKTARSNMLTGHYSFIKAKAELEKALGMETEDQLIELLQ